MIIKDLNHKREMRKIISAFIALCWATTLSAQTSATEWIEQLEESLGGRFAYTLSVSVGEESEPLVGRVMVDGDSYYMSLEAKEVYSDGKLRYEIDNQRKEVTEDRVDLTSHDILINPTRAFSFAPEEYSMKLRFSQNDELAIVVLTPLDDSFGVATIFIALTREVDRVCPTQIGYDYDGDSVIITLSEYEDDGWKMPKWSEANYKAYDIVSFL